MKSLHQIKSALISGLSSYQPQEGVLASASRMITRLDPSALSGQYLQNLQEIQNEAIQNINAAKTVEAVVAALVVMRNRLKIVRGEGSDFGNFEEAIRNVLQSFTQENQGSYCSALLTRSGLNQYFRGASHQTESSSLMPIDDRMIFAFFSALNEKFFALFSEETRLICVSQLLRAASKEAFFDALVNLVFQKLVEESKRFSFLFGNSAIVSFVNSLKAALHQCEGIDEKELMSEVGRKANANENRKLQESYEKMNAALNPAPVSASASSEDKKPFSFLGLFKKSDRTDVPRQSSSSSSSSDTSAPDPYRIKILPESTASEIETRANVKPNDTITYYNIARNNPLDLAALGAKERKMLAQVSESLKSSREQSEVSYIVSEASGILSGASDISSIRNKKEKICQARLYCNLVTSEFIKQIKTNALTKILTDYLEEAINAYLSAGDKSVLGKIVIYRYKQCLKIATEKRVDFPYNSVNGDINSLLQAYQSQPDFQVTKKQEKSAKGAETDKAREIARNIDDIIMVVETKQMAITERAINDYGLIAYDAKPLERLAASYRLIAKCNEIIETSELTQDLRFQGDFLAQAFLEKINSVTGVPVALQQQFKVAQAIVDAPALQEYIPILLGYPLEIVDTQQQFKRQQKLPKKTYWVRNPPMLCQTDAQCGVRIFDEVGYLSERLGSETPLENVKQILDHTLIKRGGYSISDRTLSSVLQGVDTIEESPVELLQFDPQSQEQYQNIVHALPCSFNMGVFFILQYASDEYAGLLLNISNDSQARSLEFDATYRLVLPQKIFASARILLDGNHSNKEEILDLLRQLSAIFITINQLEKLNNFNDIGLLKQILELPRIIDSLKTELNEQKNLGARIMGDAQLDKLIKAIDEVTIERYQDFSEKFSSYDFDSDDLLEEVLDYIGRFGDAERKTDYFNRLKGKIFSNNNYVKVYEKIAAIERYARVLGVNLDDPVIEFFVPRFIGLMKESNEIFFPEFDRFLNKISNAEINKRCIEEYEKLITESFDELFDIKKAPLSADELFNWVVDFASKVQNAGAALGYTFELTEAACFEKFINHYLSIDVNRFVNTRFSSHNDFEMKFLKCSADLISNQMISRKFNRRADYIGYVNKVAEQLLQHYVTWLKDPGSIESNNAGFDDELQYLLSGTVYEDCSRELFLQDQIALSISKKDFAGAEVLLKRLYPDAENVIRKNVQLIIRLLNAASTVDLNAFEVFLSPIRQEDEVFCGLLQQVVNGAVFNAVAVKNIRGILGSGLILVDDAPAAVLARMDAAEVVENIQGENSATAATELAQRLTGYEETLEQKKQEILNQLNAMKTNVRAYNSMHKPNRREVAANIITQIDSLISDVNADPFALTKEKINAFKNIVNNAKNGIAAEYKWLSPTRSRLYRILNDNIFSDTNFDQIKFAENRIKEVQASKVEVEAQLINLNIINRFQAVDFSAVAFNEESFQEISQVMHLFNPEQKNAVETKILGAFSSLMRQLKAFPEKINFPIENIIYLIKLSQQLDGAVQRSLVDDIKLNLKQFFDQYNVEALIARAFTSPMDLEQFENIKNFIKIQKIPFALQEGINIELELDFTNINTPADFALEAEKRKYLELCALGRRNEQLGLSCKATLETFVGVSSQAVQAVAEETSQAFSARLWESVGDKTLLQRYKFKIWNCFQEDLDRADPEELHFKLDILRNFEAPVVDLSEQYFQQVLLSWIETAIKTQNVSQQSQSKLNNIKLCIESLNDQSNFDSQIMALLTKAFSDEGLTDQSSIALVKEAFSLLGFALFQLDNHEGLIGQINRFFSDETKSTKFGEFYRKDGVLRKMMKLYESKIHIAATCQRDAARVFSQDERTSVEDFYRRSADVLSNFCTDSKIPIEIQNARTVHTRITQFYSECILNNGDSIVSLDQLILILEQWSSKLRPASLSLLIDDIVINAEYCKESILFQRQCDLLSAPSQSQSVEATATAASETQINTAVDLGFVTQVFNTATSIKSDASRGDIQEILLQHHLTNQGVCEIYALAVWYKEKTDSGRKVFANNSKNKVLISQYNQLMINLKVLGKMEKSTITPDLINEIKDKIVHLEAICKKLKLDKSKTGLFDSSLMKLLKAMDHIVDEMFPNKQPRDQIARQTTSSVRPDVNADGSRTSLGGFFSGKVTTFSTPSAGGGQPFIVNATRF